MHEDNGNMLISDVFPTKYVTAADLQGRTITLTIKAVTLEEMLTHDNKTVSKPVAWFERTMKGLVMNATNARVIANLYGDNTDAWMGKRINIYPTQVRAFGKMTDCIRVREEIPATPKPVAQATAVEETTGIDDDEDIADDGDQMWEPDVRDGDGVA